MSFPFFFSSSIVQFYFDGIIFIYLMLRAYVEGMLYIGCVLHMYGNYSSKTACWLLYLCIYEKDAACSGVNDIE